MLAVPSTIARPAVLVASSSTPSVAVRAAEEAPEASWSVLSDKVPAPAMARPPAAPIVTPLALVSTMRKLAPDIVVVTTPVTARAALSTRWKSPPWVLNAANAPIALPVPVSITAPLAPALLLSDAATIDPPDCVIVAAPLFRSSAVVVVAIGAVPMTPDNAIPVFTVAVVSVALSLIVPAELSVPATVNAGVTAVLRALSDSVMLAPETVAAPPTVSATLSVIETPAVPVSVASAAMLLPPSPKVTLPAVPPSVATFRACPAVCVTAPVVRRSSVPAPWPATVRSVDDVTLIAAVPTAPATPPRRNVPALIVKPLGEKPSTVAPAAVSRPMFGTVSAATSMTPDGAVSSAVLAADVRLSAASEIVPPLPTTSLPAAPRLTFVALNRTALLAVTPAVTLMDVPACKSSVLTPLGAEAVSAVMLAAFTSPTAAPSRSVVADSVNVPGANPKTAALPAASSPNVATVFGAISMTPPEADKVPFAAEAARVASTSVISEIVPPLSAVSVPAVVALPSVMPLLFCPVIRTELPRTAPAITSALVSVNWKLPVASKAPSVLTLLAAPSTTPPVALPVSTDAVSTPDALDETPPVPALSVIVPLPASSAWLMTTEPAALVANPAPDFAAVREMLPPAPDIVMVLLIAMLAPASNASVLALAPMISAFTVRLLAACNVTAPVRLPMTSASTVADGADEATAIPPAPTSALFAPDPDATIVRSVGSIRIEPCTPSAAETSIVPVSA